MTQPQDTFFASVRDTYGHNTVKILKVYIKSLRQIIKCKAQVKFLIKCRRYDILPKHIQKVNSNLKHFKFTSRSIQRSFNNILHKFKITLLNKEIEDKNIQLTYWTNKSERLIKKLNSILPVNLIDKFVETQTERNNKLWININNTHKKKFTNISNIYVNNNRINGKSNLEEIHLKTLKEKWFCNLTNLDIPNEICEILSLGPKFCYSSELNIKNVIDILKNVETLINLNEISNDCGNKIRGSIIDSIQTHKNRTKHISYEDRIFSQKLKKATIFSKNHNILYTMADKGSVTVAITRDSYISKMNDLLSDNSNYEQVKKNPLPNLQIKIKNVMKRWNDNNFFSKKYHNNELTQTNTNIPKIYGLPKIHKTGIPLRPIVSSIGSPTHKLSKIIDNIIKTSITLPKSFVKDSMDLIKNINNIHTPDDHILISLDVTSLFTNTPLELVRNAIEKRCNQIRLHCNIPLKEIIDTVTLLMDSTYFQFNNKFYKQIHGTPMGSPCSPRLANLVMTDLEETCLNKLTFKPLLFYRYVDDIFTIIPKEKIDETLLVFNSYHPRLKFTHELESQNSINFLEVKIIRENNKLITDWYQKATYSGRILNFKSKHTLAQKRAMVYTMVDKAILLSDKKFHIKNINYIKEILKDNSYPDIFINNNVNYRIKKLSSTHPHNYTSDRKLKLVLPYTNKFFENISDKLKKYNVTTIPRFNNNLSKLITRGKDNTALTEQTNVVYKLKCKNCDATYVGETKRKMSVRIKEHEKNIQKDDQLFVINEHVKNLGHQIDFENPQILDREDNWHKRIFSEMIHINLQKNAINKKDDSQKLQSTYIPLINRIKHNK